MKKLNGNNFKLNRGAIEIFNLLDAPLTLPAQEMFPTVSHSEWKEYQKIYPAAFAGINNWSGRISCNLIRTSNKNILVDTGIGPSETDFAQRLNTKGILPKQLQEIGIAPTDIDVVFLTHLHADHVGWNTHLKNGKPFFPNAKYYASKADWEMCNHRLKKEPEKAAYIRENIIPLQIQGYLELIKDDRFTIDTGITAFSVPGHTPGQMAIQIDTENEKNVWLLADSFTHPLQITNPKHRYIFDISPDQAIKTRFKLLKKITEKGGILGGCHFPAPGFGRLYQHHGATFWESCTTKLTQLFL